MNDQSSRGTCNSATSFVPGHLMALVLLGFSTTVVGQTGGPTSDTFPLLDFNDSQKSIIVGLEFYDRYNVSETTTMISPDRTHGRAGDPPLLQVEILNVDGVVLEKYNAWHPLWTFVEDNLGEESRMLRPNGAVTQIATEFRSNVSRMVVSDIAADQALISINLLKSTHPFCRDNPDDLDCLNLANTPPVCVANVPAVTECTGDSTAVDLDGSGSFDPDDDTLISHIWTGEFDESPVSDETVTVQVRNVGYFLVNLEIEDDFAGLSRCDTTGSIVDTTSPVAFCNNAPTIEPPDTPVTYTSIGTDSCSGSVVTTISDYQCYRIRGDGSRLDTTRSCRISIDEGALSIRNSGGVGNHIEWTILATDAAGNTDTSTCSVAVVNSGQ